VVFQNTYKMIVILITIGSFLLATGLLNLAKYIQQKNQ